MTARKNKEREQKAGENVEYGKKTSQYKGRNPDPIGPQGHE